MFVAIVAILKPWEKNRENHRTHSWILTQRMHWLFLLCEKNQSLWLGLIHSGIFYLTAESISTEMALPILESIVSLALFLRFLRIPRGLLLSLSPLDGILDPCSLSHFQQLHFLSMQLCSTTWGHQLSFVNQSTQHKSVNCGRLLRKIWDWEGSVWQVRQRNELFIQY